MKEVDELYRLYGKDIYGYIFSLTKEKSLSEDLLQETFLQAIGGINKFNADSSVKTWLFSIARNVWFNYLRQNKKQPDFAILSDIASHENIEESTINSEKVKLILDFISQKDEKARQVMMLRIEGFSFWEIAARLHLSEGSARVLFHRGKISIIKYLKENDYD